MHELSIALGIIEATQAELGHVGGRVCAVHVRVGELSGVVREALLSSYEIACMGTPLEGSQLLVEDVPVVVFCPQCNALRPVHSVQWFCCSDCGTPTGDIRQGRELELVALEIEE